MYCFCLPGVQLTLEIQGQCGPTLKEFRAKLLEDDVQKKIAALKDEVETFAEKFPMPGHDDM